MIRQQVRKAVKPIVCLHGKHDTVREGIGTDHEGVQTHMNTNIIQLPGGCCSLMAISSMEMVGSPFQEVSELLIARKTCIREMLLYIWSA